MAEPLEERITRLERKLRVWQLLAAGVLVVSCATLAFVIVGRWPAEEIRARSFSLVNDSGEVLAQLADNSKYGPFLVIHSKQVGADVVLGSMGIDAGLGILEKGETRISLAVGKNGTSLGLADEKGKGRLLATLDDAHGSSPVLVLSDASGRPRLSLDTSNIRLRDEQGKPFFSTAP